MFRHVRMMSIVIYPVPCALECLDDIPAPKEEDMGN